MATTELVYEAMMLRLSWLHVVLLFHFHSFHFIRSDLGPEVGYQAIGRVESSLPTVGVFAQATAEDTPEAVVKKTGESLRSETEAEEVSASLSLHSVSFGCDLVFALLRGFSDVR
jgi:hypothetical protein